MRVRGLKQCRKLFTSPVLSVAPYAGAWIETVSLRGMFMLPLVAPYAGAWIETYILCNELPSLDVAPYAGAWIETLCAPKDSVISLSHPMRVRGLKPHKQAVEKVEYSRTLCGCVD